MSTSEAVRHLTKEITKSGLSRRDWYRTVYLRSSHWSNLREEAFKHHGRSCSECKKTPRSLDVHHLQYRDIYNVTVEDLQILCRRCHNRKHPKKTEARKQTIRKPRKHRPKNLRAKRAKKKQVVRARNSQLMTEFYEKLSGSRNFGREHQIALISNMLENHSSEMRQRECNHFKRMLSTLQRAFDNEKRQNK